MLKRLHIAQKFTIYFLIIGGVVLLTLSVIFYVQFKSSLLERTLLQLSSVNTLKKDHVIDELEVRKDQLHDLIELSQKIDSISLVDHVSLLNLSNAALISQQGELIWIERPVYKETLVSIKNTLTDVPIVSEITHPTKDELEIAFTYPLKNGTWVVLIEHAKDIENILYERTGLGTTGESYIVGMDSLMRTKSRFYPNEPPSKFKVNTRVVAKALQGKTGKDQIIDYRDVQVLSAYRNIQVDQINWAILSEIDVAEAMRPVIALRNRLFIISLFTLALLLMLSWVLAQRIAQPIIELKETILEVAQGNLPDTSELQKGHDEIGQMTDAVEHLIAGLRKVILFAQNIGYGNFDVSYTPLSPEDQLGKSLSAMLNQLQSYRSKTKLLDLRNKKALLEGQESERARLARDIHDGIGPLLTAIKLQIATLDNNTEKKEELKSQLDHTIQEVRRISNNLMPAVLLDFGVGAALKNLIEGISKSSPIQFTYKDDLLDENSKLSSEVNIALYRIVQEAINNVIKHAQASSLKISLTEFEDRVSVFIADDGKGFKYNSDHLNELTTHGLRNMRDRIQLLGGEISVHSSKLGTTIEFDLPL